MFGLLRNFRTSHTMPSLAPVTRNIRSNVSVLVKQDGIVPFQGYQLHSDTRQPNQVVSYAQQFWQQSVDVRGPEVVYFWDKLKKCFGSKGDKKKGGKKTKKQSCKKKKCGKQKDTCLKKKESCEKPGEKKELCKTEVKKDEKKKEEKKGPCKKDEKKADGDKKQDPCKKEEKKEDPCKKKEDPCKKKEDPCKKKEEKKEDPCKKKEDPCKKKEVKKEDPCKKKEDPCKKKEDPCKKKEDPCKKKEVKKEDPCKKEEKKEDPCKKKEDPCKKKEDPCKKKEVKKEDPCKKEEKKEDPCKKKEDPCKKKDDPCKKEEKKEDPCKKKEDPCKKEEKKEDPCKKDEKKEDPCKKDEKKEDPCKKKEDPCKKKEDPCKKNDPCAKFDTDGSLSQEPLVFFSLTNARFRKEEEKCSKPCKDPCAEGACEVLPGQDEPCSAASSWKIKVHPCKRSSPCSPTKREVPPSGPCIIDKVEIVEQKLEPENDCGLTKHPCGKKVCPNKCEVKRKTKFSGIQEEPQVAVKNLLEVVSYHTRAFQSTYSLNFANARGSVPPIRAPDPRKPAGQNNPESKLPVGQNYSEKVAGLLEKLKGLWQGSGSNPVEANQQIKSNKPQLRPNTQGKRLFGMLENEVAHTEDCSSQLKGAAVGLESLSAEGDSHILFITDDFEKCEDRVPPCPLEPETLPCPAPIDDCVKTTDDIWSDIDANWGYERFPWKSNAIKDDRLDEVSLKSDDPYANHKL